MNILVSVIIPVFNTEKFLERTFSCLENQTYGDWEAIFINDGSTDRSRELLDKFKKKDDRVKVINSENNGVSVARNKGIELAKGQKILFLDSDDIFESTLIEDCIEFMNEKKVESVIYGYADYADGVIFNEHVFTMENDIYTGQEQIVLELLPHFFGISYNDIDNWISGKNSMRYGKEHTALWRIMCDTKCIKDNKIAFNPQLTLGEDTMFINEYIFNSSSIGVLKKTLYYLVQREGSANYNNNHKIELMIENKLKIAEAKECFAEKVKFNSGYDIKSYFQGNNILSALQVCILLSKDKRYSLEHGREKYLEFCNNKYIKEAIDRSSLKFGVKKIPFILLRRMKNVLYIMCRIMPRKIIEKVI